MQQKRSWIIRAQYLDNEMSAAVSRLRAGVDPLLPGPDKPRDAHEIEAGVLVTEPVVKRLRGEVRRRGSPKRGSAS